MWSESVSSSSLSLSSSSPSLSSSSSVSSTSAVAAVRAVSSYFVSSDVISPVTFAHMSSEEAGVASSSSSSSSSSAVAAAAAVAAAFESVDEALTTESSIPLVDIQNITILNVTADVPIAYAMVMNGYIMPYLLIITLIANTLIVIVLGQKHMTSPTNLVLLTMAISDALTLFVPAPWYFYLYTLDYHSKRLLYPTSICYAYYLSIEVIPAFFHTVPGVKKSIIIVFICAFLHQSTRSLDRIFAPVRFVSEEGKMTYACQFGTAPWVDKYFGEDVYYITYYSFRVIFVNSLPCTVLVVLNILLLRALRRAQKNRAALFAGNNRSNESRRARDSYGTTLMLIVIVTVFLMVEIPLAVCIVLHLTQNALHITIADYNTLNLTILFSNFVISLSYPVNFAIYCGMSTQFRQTFNSIFCKSRLEPSVNAATTVVEACESPDTRAGGKILNNYITVSTTTTSTNATATTVVSPACAPACATTLSRASLVNGPQANICETNL